MDSQHHEQCKRIEHEIHRLENDVVDLKGAFDAHLRIYSQNGKEMAALQQEVSDFKKSMNSNFIEVKEMMKENRSIYATKESIKPIKMLVFGATGIMLSGLLGGMLTLVVK